MAGHGGGGIEVADTYEGLDAAVEDEASANEGVAGVRDGSRLG